MHSALDHFEPNLARWFTSRFTSPTGVQAAAWPLIAGGEHVLATAPTGSGKTLTAFFCALNRFARGDWQPGRTHVLYVSPLKALNNDIRVNLLEPLDELKAQSGFPDLRVKVRSGDTPQTERQRMLRTPPDILITTPESLHLLLTSPRGQMALAGVETVIIDEVHAIADNRRGAQLMVSLERLAHLAGEFQRIALSATVSPLEAVARYVGGRTPQGEARHMQIVRSDDEKQLQLTVRFPEAARRAAEEGKKIWEPLADDFRQIIERNQSTLFFTNSRALAEKITLKVNEGATQTLAYAHHGSLARDIRSEVERRLKAGELSAIVATSSLEMGIDVGALDEVVLVQSPPSIAATLQRIGRAGHQVGATSVGTLFPTHANDMLEAAVLAEQISKRDIEPIRPMCGALDVLVQVIISMCASEERKVDDLYQQVTCAGSYVDLPRSQFDLVIEMLAGRYAGARVRELKPRIDYDRLAGTVKSRRSALLTMYSSGGNIPDRGYFKLRHADSAAQIGELDEEFVWEATVGQVFTLGTQNWQIQRITHNDVFVRQASPNVTAPPFWRAEAFNRGFYFSERIGRYLETVDALLSQGDHKTVLEELTSQRCFEVFAAGELLDYLRDQRQHCGTPLPHRHHVLFELVEGGPDGYRGPNAPKQLIIHTMWGGALNRPMSYALEAALRRQGNKAPEVHADDNAIVIQMREIPDLHDIAMMVNSQNFDELLREGLERSGYFGARFRECAGRGLLLSKQRFDRRLPLWMSRLQAKKLMTSIKSFEDFPMLLETWRTCLQDEFDLPALRMMLDELRDGTCSISFAHTPSPSPFAAVLRFQQIGRYMYADDSPEVPDVSALNADLIAAAVNDPSLRPDLDKEIVREFVAKRQRTAAGYAPDTEEEQVAWLKERVLVPQSEWPWSRDLAGLTQIRKDDRIWVCHIEHLPVWLATGVQSDTRRPDLTPLMNPLQASLEVLSFYGPLREGEIAALLPSVPDGLFEALSAGVRIAGVEGNCFCDSENLDAILRFQRARARVTVDPLSFAQLPGHWARQQQFGRAYTEAAAGDIVEQLSGVCAPVSVWLDELIQCRLPTISEMAIDQSIAECGFIWQGCGKERITLCYPEDTALQRVSEQKEAAPGNLFQDASAGYTFAQIAERSTDTESLNSNWWDAVWSGSLTCDGLTPLRDASRRNYKLSRSGTATSRRQRLRGLVRGWQGTWRQTRQPASEDDPLSTLEQNKERTRILLERYGLLCREIVTREGWTWRDIFRALRIMELAGEVIQGYYVEGLSGPQFITPASLQRLALRGAAPEHWWMNATDPASPCGLGLDWPELPQRRSANYLAFFAGELALVVENGGKKLTYFVPSDHSALDGVNEVLRHLVTKKHQLEVQTINGENTRKSPYAAALGRICAVASDHKSMYLSRELT